MPVTTSLKRTGLATSRYSKDFSLMSSLGNYAKGLPLTKPVSLVLDFLQDRLDPRITFTRASSGTHFDSTGRLVTDANDIARFDYDPATAAGVTGGELVTNGDFSNGTTGWSESQVGIFSVVSGEARITSNGAGAMIVSQAFTTSIGKTYRVTATVRVGVSGSDARVSAMTSQFGGTINSAATTSTSATAISFNFVAAGTTTYIGPRISGAVAAGETVFADNISVQEVTFTPRGLLIEEARTNLILHSRDMTQAAWSKTDVTAARTQVGIDGVANTACLMTEGSAGTAVTYGNGAAVTAGATVTGSFVLKRGNTDWVQVLVQENTFTNGGQCYFNLGTGALGTVSAKGAGTAVTAAIVSLGGGWYRCSVSCIPSGVYTIPQILINSAVGNNNGTRVANATYIVDCAQLEVGAFATSIITTGAATATRAAESASMTGTNFSSWFNATQGTFVAEAAVPNAVPSGNFPQVVNVGNGGNSNMKIGYLTSSAAAFEVQTAGVSQASLYPATASSTRKLAASFALNDFAVCVNAGTVSTDISGTIPTVDRLTIGYDAGGAGQHINGHIRSIRFYSVRLPNATLQSLTA